jgi:uncharacterized membrane protein
MKTKGMKNDNGATLALIAISLTMLITAAAVVVDIGQLYVARERAQDVADASARAGAWLVGVTAAEKNSARAAAQAVVGANSTAEPGWPTSAKEISFPSMVTTDAGGTIGATDGKAVKVVCTVPVTYSFARIIPGLVQKNVDATAIAVKQSQSHLVYYLAPWMVSYATAQTLQLGVQTRKLRMSRLRGPRGFQLRILDHPRR